MVTIYKELSPYESIFSSNEEIEEYYLISNIGEEEYQCVGSCFCDNAMSRQSEKRRTPSSFPAIRTGLLYLLTAVSSIIAHEQAKQYFSSNCETILSDSCELIDIRSEVENCEYIYPTTHIEEEEEQQQQQEEEEEKEEKEEKLNDRERHDLRVEQELRESRIRVQRQKEIDLQGVRKYMCYGFCSKRSFKSSKARMLATEFDCESLETEGEVEVDPALFNGYDLNNRAKELFRKTTLTPFCKMQSVGEYVYTYEGGKKSNPFARVQTVFLCGNRKRNVRCVSLDDRRSYNAPPSHFQKIENYNLDDKSI